MGFILGFMLRFGALSSLFDAFTFGLLWYGFAAGPALFRTGWFIESLLTELAIALVVSLLHLGDMLNSLNVVRHWESSWLSREILLGVSFAAFGFLFALMEWFGWGSYVLRQVVAGLTALLGIALLVAESMIYYTLVTVPAWNSWMVPFSFFATAALLGVLAVGAALMATTLIRARRAETAVAEPQQSVPDQSETSPSGGGLMVQVRSRIRQINAPTSATEWKIVSAMLSWFALIGALVAVAILIAYPLYLGSLAANGSTAAMQSLEVLTGPLLWVRLACAGVTALILGFFVYRKAETTKLHRSTTLVAMAIIGWVFQRDVKRIDQQIENIRHHDR